MTNTTPKYGLMPVPASSHPFGLVKNLLPALYIFYLHICVPPSYTPLFILFCPSPSFSTPMARHRYPGWSPFAFEPSKCGTCERVLTCSLIDDEDSDDGSAKCARCQPYEDLVASVQGAEEAWGREMARVKQSVDRSLYLKARANYDRCKKDYANFMLEIESVADTVAEKSEHTDLKRRREKDSSPTCNSSPKRRCSSENGLRGTRNRVRFHDSIISKLHVHRPSDFYKRSHAAYFPGNHAPAEGVEFWDTSGCSMLPDQFYQSAIKRVPTASAPERSSNHSLQNGNHTEACEEELEIDPELEEQILDEEIENAMNGDPNQRRDRVKKGLVRIVRKESDTLANDTEPEEDAEAEADWTLVLRTL